jgi:hypothetical protein
LRRSGQRQPAHGKSKANAIGFPHPSATDRLGILVTIIAASCIRPRSSPIEMDEGEGRGRHAFAVASTPHWGRSGSGGEGERGGTCRPGRVEWFASPTGSTTAQTLYSGILATGSRAAFVKRFAVASAKWKGMKTVPGMSSAVSLAQTLISPRRGRRRNHCAARDPEPFGIAGCSSTVASPSRRPSRRRAWRCSIGTSSSSAPSSTRSRPRVTRQARSQPRSPLPSHWPPALHPSRRALRRHDHRHGRRPPSRTSGLPRHRRPHRQRDHRGCSSFREPGACYARRCTSSRRALPLHLDIGEIQAAMLTLPAGVRLVHDLHVWTLTSSRETLSAHVEVDSERFGIAHTTRQLSCSSASGAPLRRSHGGRWAGPQASSPQARWPSRPSPGSSGAPDSVVRPS